MMFELAFVRKHVPLHTQNRKGLIIGLYSSCLPLIQRLAGSRLSLLVLRFAGLISDLLLPAVQGKMRVSQGLGGNPWPCGERAQSAATAPELILLIFASFQGEVADVWSCGVTLYVMLVGAYPFEDPNDPRNFRKAIQRIMSVNYTIPPSINLTDSCVDLIKKIFVADPTQRLTVEGVISHPWFQQDLPQSLKVGVFSCLRGSFLLCFFPFASPLKFLLSCLSLLSLSFCLILPLYISASFCSGPVGLCYVACLPIACNALLLS